MHNHLHFADEETEVTQLVSGEARCTLSSSFGVLTLNQ